MTVKILILEDMPDTQNWLKQACLLAYPEARVTVVASIEQAEAYIKQFQPTMALLDLELPDGKGHAFIPPLLKKHPSCICIVVTIYADENHLLPSLSAGARGYILKDQTKQRIAQMLKQAMWGELPLSPAAANLVLNQFAGNQSTATASPLTRRENDVLSLIAKGASTKEVAERLDISKYTVEDHLKQIYKKLNISSRAQAALAARQLNLI
ncbi:MAG: response regulator transcription factor [Pseudomonadales bacterium]|nr:response regulator transcription factor [Pseudomonadales bacterium]